MESNSQGERGTLESGALEAPNDAAYRFLVANSLDAILLTAPEGSILDANPAAERLFGRTTEELRRLGRASIVDCSDPRLAAAIAERARTGRFRGELTARRADGSTFPAEFATAVFRDPTGRELTSMVVRDLTDQRRLEGALQESERRLRLAQSAAKAGTWEWDITTNDNFWTDEVFRLYGYEPGSRAPSYAAWRDSILPADRPMAEMAVADAARRGTPFEIAWHVAGTADPVRWLLSRGEPQLDAAGRPVRYHGIVLDITAQKRAEAELQNAYEQLAQIVATTPGIVSSFRLRPDGSSCFPVGGDRIAERFGVSCAQLAQAASGRAGSLRRPGASRRGMTSSRPDVDMAHKYLLMRKQPEQRVA